MRLRRRWRAWSTADVALLLRVLPRERQQAVQLLDG